MLKIQVKSFKPSLTKPAPLDLASRTSHMIAAFILVCWSFAARTLANVMCEFPKFVSSFAFVVAFAKVPDLSAFETCSLSTFAISPVPTAARLTHDVFAIRFRTPF